MIAIVDGAESLLVWNSHVRASEAKNLCGTYMQVCEATWEGKESKRDWHPGRIIFYFIWVMKASQMEFGVCTCICINWLVLQMAWKSCGLI